jgi:hypothetical protein
MIGKRDKASKSSGGSWRDRQMLPEGDFTKVMAAVAKTLPSQDITTIAVAVVRALGYTVPRAVLWQRTCATSATADALVAVRVEFVNVLALTPNHWGGQWFTA